MASPTPKPSALSASPPRRRIGYAHREKFIIGLKGLQPRPGTGAQRQTLAAVGSGAEALDARVHARVRTNCNTTHRDDDRSTRLRRNVEGLHLTHTLKDGTALYALSASAEHACHTLASCLQRLSTIYRVDDRQRGGNIDRRHPHRSSHQHRPWHRHQHRSTASTSQLASASRVMMRIG